MKKTITILSALMMLSATSANAQSENPRGLYKLQTFFYEDGTGKAAPFQQYKYCGENAALTFVTQENKELGIVEFTMQNLDGKPDNYTGLRPVGEDGRGIQIYDSSQKEFKLRWFNDRFTNHPNFPDSSWIGETYSSTKDISPLVTEAIKALKTKEWKSKNRFVGVWHRRGWTANASGEYMVTPAPEMYKIYTEKNVLILGNINDEPEDMQMACQYWPCKYFSDQAIQEASNNCFIHWVSDSTLTLTWFPDGNPEVEVWDRCGLPDNLQTLFGTSMPNTYAELIQPSASDVVYPADSVDVLPSFVGGETAFSRFISKEMQRPKAYRTYIRPQINVSFIVERDGSISGCEIIGISEQAGKTRYDVNRNLALQAVGAEAIRVMQLMPRWTPAVKDGKYVRSRTSRQITVPTDGVWYGYEY